MKVRDALLTAVLWLILFQIIAAPFLLTLKLGRFGSDVPAFFTYAYILTQGIIGFACWIYLFHTGLSVAFLSLVLIFGLSLALVVQPLQQLDIQTAVGNILRIVGFSGILSIGMYLSPRLLLGYLPRLSRISLISSVVAIPLAIFSGLYVSGSFYWGIQVPLDLAISTSLGASQHFLSFFIFLLSLLSGKRGLILSIIATVFLLIIFNLRNKRSLQVIAITSSLCLVFLPLSISPASLCYFDSFGQTQILKRYGLCSYDDVNVRQLTAGRNIEIESGIDALSSPRIALFGMGISPAFIYVEDSGDVSEDSTNHFSPLSMAAILGIPITLLFYFSGFVLVLRHISPGSMGSSILALDRICAIAIFFALVYSFSTFSILQQPYLPLFWGYLLRRRSRI